MHRSSKALASGTLVLVLALAPVQGAGTYVADPDPARPTLHVQPPALRGSAAEAASAVSGTINGIDFIDVLAAAGFDIGGADLGNEPALTASPLDPNRIVLTSFSGSDWSSGGNAALFYSGDGGSTWTYSLSIPPPPGDTSVGCPCDQTLDWGRDGFLYGTFLNFRTDGTTSAVYSAQATNPTDPASWVYRTSGGVAQTTNLPGYPNPDQPWLWSGPLPGDNAVTNVCVAYDKFDPSYSFSQMHVADSPGAVPLDFTSDAASNADGDIANDGMNPGTRVAVGPDGKIWNVFQRYEGTEANGVKRITYLVTVSTDGGQTWSVANSDHASGAKLIVSNVFSFQGNGSKVGGVNALLGGSDAITVDPRTGTAWVVYGLRPTLTGVDQLFLVPVTYDSGNLNVGTPHMVSPAVGARFYMPSVAVLASGEIGVLFMGFATSFTWRFVQTTDGGVTLAKSTTLATFTSPFATNPSVSNQRILGDYVQVRALGCTFYGTYPARGTGTNSATSIDPYFMKAPAALACTLPSLTSLDPSAVCAGSPGASLSLTGSGFFPGTTGRIQGALRSTSYQGPTQVTTTARAVDLATPGTRAVDLLGAAPAGGRTASLPLLVETPAASPGSSLRLSKSGGVQLDWAASPGASSYDVRRCAAAPRPCTPANIASPPSNTFSDPTLLDGNDYWYLIDSVNSCGAVP